LSGARCHKAGPFPSPFQSSAADTCGQLLLYTADAQRLLTPEKLRRVGTYLLQLADLLAEQEAAPLDRQPLPV
jgi:hypothetical protein